MPNAQLQPQMVQLGGLKNESQHKAQFDRKAVDFQIKQQQPANQRAIWKLRSPEVKTQSELNFESQPLSGHKLVAANVFHQDFRSFVAHQKSYNAPPSLATSLSQDQRQVEMANHVGVHLTHVAETVEDSENQAEPPESLNAATAVEAMGFIKPGSTKHLRSAVGTHGHGSRVALRQERNTQPAMLPVIAHQGNATQPGSKAYAKRTESSYKKPGQ